MKGKNKMGVMGVGGKIAVVLVAALLPTLLLSTYVPALRIPSTGYPTLYAVGGVLAVVGFSLNLLAAMHMLRAHKEDRLATGGLYRVFRDPMYVLQLFVTLPGLLLMAHSWPALLAIPAAYIAYRRFVREEHSWLQQRYGEAYKAYVKSVPIKL